VAGTNRSVASRSFDELWRELEEVPEGFIGEIVDGEIVMTPRPDPPHTSATSDLGVLLGAWFRFGIGGPGGWIILDEPRIRFADETRVPDLAGWRRDRFAAPARGPYTVIPDWICEALSPGTARKDRTEKMPLYARHGVGHLWLLDPVVQTLEVYRLETGNWVSIGTFGGDATVRAELFDAVELDLTLVWGPKREPEGP
jgi:Uma2 family endonuclease